MTNQKLLFAGALAAVFAFGVSDARAQTATTGAIQGVVNDSATGESLAGVTVVATSPALQGNQSVFTDGSGFYKITNLPPGTYEVAFYFAEVTVRRTNVQVSINNTTPVYAKIDMTKAGGEEIIIKRKAPTVDPTSTSQGVTLDQDYTRNIPVPGRTFEDALGAAAGTAGDALGVSFSGSTSLENQYVVDGVNTTGLTFGTVGSPLINDFIQEIEIITGGYQAEYGRSTGGVVNVVTKSGSNEFHGSVFNYFSSGILRADSKRAPTESGSIDATSDLTYDFNFGFDLGGPIVKDKVWFYVGFAPRLIGVDVDRFTKRRTDCRTIDAEGNLSECDPRTALEGGNADGSADEDPETGFLIYEDLDVETRRAQSQEFQFVSKVNYAMAPEHQGQVTLSATPYFGETFGVLGEDSATQVDFASVTSDLAIKWTSKFNDNKTEVEVVAGWHRSSYKQDAADDAFNDTSRQDVIFGNLYTLGNTRGESALTSTGCQDNAQGGMCSTAADCAAGLICASDGVCRDPYSLIENCPITQYSIGGPGVIFDEVEDRKSGRVSVTQRVKAVGNHEIKGGMDIEDNNATAARNYTGDTYYQVYLGNSTNLYRWVQLAPPDSTEARYDELCGQTVDQFGMAEDRRCDHLTRTDIKGNTLNWSAYLRDSWQILPNLTMNVGMRYEEQRLRYAKNLQNTIDPFTGRTLGKNAMTMNNMWAPRLGLLYDWTKEGRSKVYTSWGRFYESIPMDINDRSFGGETQYIEIYTPDQCGPSDSTIGGPSGPGCAAEGMDPVSDQLFGGATLVAPGIKPQYLDELILGIEYEVFEDLKFGVAWKNRRLGRVLEDVSVDNANTYIIANPGEFDSGEETALINRINALETTDPERIRLEGQLEQFQGIRTFDKPTREYNAVEITATKRFSKNFFAQASYTYSRTKGNFPGLFSADNGQVDPNITSQYDLIELLANRDGPLPQDQPHYFKLDGYYKWDFKRAGLVTTGARIRALSGVPVNALGGHYLYGLNESFLLPRGSRGRTDIASTFDFHLAYGRKLSGGMQVEVFADIFNLFNSQETARRDQAYTYSDANPVVGGEYEDLIWLKQVGSTGGESPDPVTRNRNFGNPSARYGPLNGRLGARLIF